MANTTTIPFVAATNTERMTDRAESLVTALRRCHDTRTQITEAAEGGLIGDDLVEWAKGDLEAAEQAVADAIAALVCDYTNVMLPDFERRLALGFRRQHATLHANALRAVLEAAQERKGDGRIPEWAQNSEHLGVPSV